MKTMRSLCALLFSMALASCGVAQRIQAQEQVKQLASQSDAVVARCNAQFPVGNPGGEEAAA